MYTNEPLFRHLIDCVFDEHAVNAHGWRVRQPRFQSIRPLGVVQVIESDLSLVFLEAM